MDDFRHNLTAIREAEISNSGWRHSEEKYRKEHPLRTSYLLLITSDQQFMQQYYKDTSVLLMDPLKITLGMLELV